MTTLKRPVRRLTNGLVFDMGKFRNVIVVLEPPEVLAFRLQGTRRVHRLLASDCYMLALKADLRAKQKEKGRKRKPKRGVL